VKDVPIDVDGFTSVELYVGDYAASATLAVTIDGGGTYTVKIPRTKGSGAYALPEAGWRSGAKEISTSILQSSADSDAEPFATGSPSAGRFGDGLTVFEEYRGFVVQGTHRRLDPSVKDLFLLMDAELLPLSTVLSSLPVVLHYLKQEEVVSYDNGNNSPVIKHVFAPGSTGQRGLRVRRRVPAPFLKTVTGDVIPAFVRLGGYTFSDGENVDLIQEGGTPNGTPNATIVVEVYPEKYQNDALYYGDTAAPTPMGDDIDDPLRKLISPGPNLILETTPEEPGQFKAEILHLCGDENVIYILNAASSEGQAMQSAVLAHEVGHGVHVDHAPVCGDLMHSRFDWVLQPGMFPTSFSESDVLQIRIH
jgi:hypothetical protein